VVFLSHCLLNQNTRYLGGAVCPGAVVDAVAPYLEAGVGIVQLPCPEQRTWGGVLKRRFLWLVAHPRVTRAGRILVGPVRPYLRWRYRRLARSVAVDIADYMTSGFDIVGVVGVAGSPSCGAGTTLDLGAALQALASCPHRRVTTQWLNQRVVTAAARPGQGLFIEALTRDLARRGIVVPTTQLALPVDQNDAPAPASSSSTARG
jgi:uncharacterized protein YbbK (DUF523 family)